MNAASIERIPEAPRERFLSLDVFRGLTIFLMILVNTAGPGAEPYSELVHAHWFGFTLADLVFPSFLFAVGSAMAFALRADVPQRVFLWRVLKRSALIFLFGFLMYWYPFIHRQDDGSWALNAFGQTRVMGVLQRIALCYLLAALLARYLSVRMLLVSCVGLLLGYWAVLYLFADPGLALDKLGNAGTRLDIWLLGRDHLYRKDGGFDPEGVLGTLPATVNVLAGYLTAVMLRQRGKNAASVTRLVVAAIVLLVLAWGWQYLWPLSKKLWTGSFVLWTVGLDLLLLALLTWWIEVRGRTAGSGFFTVLGRNPMAIYLFSELFVVTLQFVTVGGSGLGLYEWIGVNVFQAITPGPIGSLLCALAYTLLCWLFGLFLDRRRWYLRL